ncbi:MAG: hypothetical protein ABWZ16_02200 [Microbacterium sp.]
MSDTELSALRSCEDTALAFCDRLDEGDLDAAFALHADGLRFFPPGGSTPMGRDAARQDAARVRFAYPGRGTLHVLSGFRGRLLGDGTVAASYLMTVYELTSPHGDQARPLETPRVFALAREEAVFVRDENGSWVYTEQRMIPIGATPKART